MRASWSAVTALLAGSAFGLHSSNAAPTAKTKNGTYYGGKPSMTSPFEITELSLNNLSPFFAMESGLLPRHTVQPATYERPPFPQPAILEHVVDWTEKCHGTGPYVLRIWSYAAGAW